MRCEHPDCPRPPEYCRIRGGMATYWCYAHMLEQTLTASLVEDVWLGEGHVDPV